MKCVFCKKSVPKTRRKYCSVECIKRAWYLKNNSNTKSYYANNPEFWNTATGIGFKWEKFAAKLLGAKHLPFNSVGCDLDWGGLKVDVKVANVYRRKLKRGKPINVDNQSGWWVFNRNKEKEVDWFFCIALYQGKPYKLLLIPPWKFSRKGIIVGWKSKYDKYAYKVSV